MTTTRTQLAAIIALAALVGILATLLATQALSPRAADAGSSDAPLLRKLDTNTYRLHSDLSKLCRALAERTYACP